MKPWQSVCETDRNADATNRSTLGVARRRSLAGRGRPLFEGSIAMDEEDSPKVGRLAACPECDLLVRELQPPASRSTVLCPRCDALLYRTGRNVLEQALALACAAFVLLAVANAFPIVGLEIKGQRIDTTVIGAAARLWQEGMPLVASLVLLTTTIIPLLELAAMMWMVLPLLFGKRPPAFTQIFHVLRLTHPWAMVEVFLLGILVALVKLSHLAHVLPDIAAWLFGGVMLVMTGLSLAIEPRDLWQAWQETRE
jgi:paraquat-inducible protein A